MLSREPSTLLDLTQQRLTELRAAGEAQRLARLADTGRGRDAASGRWAALTAVVKRLGRAKPGRARLAAAGSR